MSEMTDPVDPTQALPPKSMQPETVRPESVRAEVPRAESLPVPGLPANWHVLATDKIVSTVDTVRVKTSGPAIKVSRALVFGLMGAFISLIAFIVFLIGSVRLLNNVLPKDVWLVYLILGTLFLVVGAFLWSKRPRRAAS